jgi:hypothetical protein
MLVMTCGVTIRYQFAVPWAQGVVQVSRGYVSLTWLKAAFAGDILGEVSRGQVCE